MIVSVRDELIMALADGELEPSVEEHVREAIRQDDAVRHKYEIYRVTRVLLSKAFNGILDEPVPERLTRAIMKPKRPRRR
ncbi:MAG: hypothetical protein JNN24_04980 [Hyphomicrobium zavarzinii]|jgi:anti-sigma factor RsiW|nr:hypothetical protein [Hyphomicrobium zavarzinii]MBL8845105.1 hypothetical protein [Hyphomicrobium zavarzinii]